jgi:hypothetical protein
MEKTLLARKTTHYLLMALTVATLTVAPMLKRDAHAIGGVVFDPTNFYANLNTYYQKIEQLRTAYAQLETLYSQLRAAEAQLNAMTSKSYWSRYLTQRPDWLPRTNDETQQMIEAGYNPGDQGDLNAFRLAQKKYASRYPALTQTQVSKNPSDRNWVAYNELKGSTDTSLAMAEALHDKQIAEYKDFLKENANRLDTTDDLKASVDLNNAMLQQSMAIQLDQLIISNQQLRMAALESNQNLNSMALNAEFSRKR